MGSTAETYYRAAWERIDDAYFLHVERHYSFAMYASGLAVECLLRAFRILKDSSFEERHDLWQLWKKTVLANIRRKPTYERSYALMNEINLRWRNSFRFAPADEINSFLKNADQHRGIKGDILKYNSKRLYEAARELIQLGAVQWEQLKKK
ncbi:MAG: HEPN domain-containing protein [candidate division KSB1 bacterium]|nr:HEPN domain-containing protein [candidate division KSB1 bacterium]MDZ7302476.1 HEPN domain-containing protein [candidate division KSB1 bacterium]MDZ7311928.1 HEPN domain-containing protein [candidate division KSB1 bacterium]